MGRRGGERVERRGVRVGRMGVRERVGFRERREKGSLRKSGENRC